MALTTILDNEFATLWYHTDIKVIHHHIKKYIYGEKLHELFAKGTEILQKYKAEKWLSDDRNNNALTLQDQAWANNLWFPETAKRGWKYWAIVQPEMITGKLNMNRQANIVTRGGVTVNTFSNPEEALTWLAMQ